MENFGPFTPGFQLVDYGNVDQLESLLQRIGSNVAGVFIEPIQGEAGCRVPPPGYLPRVKELCKKHNVLFILDEI